MPSKEMTEMKEKPSTAGAGPLAYGQRALWFLQQLAPDNVAYNIGTATRIRSEVDVAALRRSFQGLADRHSALKTVFPRIDGRPVQQFLAAQPVSFNHIDVSMLSDDLLMNAVTEGLHRPFNLEKGPLFRIHLFTRSTQEHILLFTFHHIIIDYYSFVIILEELGRLYGSDLAGANSPLPAVDHQYVDYVDWQIKMLESPEGESLWTYWENQLQDHSATLNLLTDHPRNSVQTYCGATRARTLSSSLCRRLKSLAESEGGDLFSPLLGAYLILLHRYSGQEDILVGSPPIGCRRPEFRRVVGFFQNPLVLRARMGHNPTIKAFLNQVRGTVNDALSHQDFPFPLLVERLQPNRDLSRSPLFQVMFVLYEAKGESVLSLLAGDPDARINLGGLEMEYLDLEQRAAMLDLTLTVVCADGPISARLQYNTDLFDDGTIAGMLEELESFLEAIVDRPEERILSLEMFKKPDRSEIRSISEGSAGDELHGCTGADLDFSIFYFGSNASHQTAKERYRLLLEGAAFADRNGFSAIWTPERHFHEFGGLFPNPSITSSAIATITENTQIRAGSVVLPLHNPIRIAEEWSVVDNLSNGRVAISFASGWHADDFVLAPDNYGNRKEIMVRDIEVVRKLWRGEPVSFVGGGGNEVHVKILPRPVQRELPVWVTAFGNPETFRLAGQIGANLLTHLLGQGVELLAEKIKIYRGAWRSHNHSGQGLVTLMLHSFVGGDSETVREKVRGPFCDYLKSSLDLLIGFAKSAALDLDPRHMTQENIEALVSHAFDRYYETCALFGTVSTCGHLIERIKAAGVDEVACLIDFGIDSDSVLSGLYHLKELMLAAKRGSSGLSATRDSQGIVCARAGDSKPPSSVRKAFDPRPSGEVQAQAAASTLPYDIRLARPPSEAELARLIQNLWRQTLQTESIGWEDDFFDKGGNPLLWEMARNRLQRTLGRDLSAVDTAKHSTISSLAKLLSEDQAADGISDKIKGGAQTRRSFINRQRQTRRKPM